MALVSWRAGQQSGRDAADWLDHAAVQAGRAKRVERDPLDAAQNPNSEPIGDVHWILDAAIHQAAKKGHSYATGKTQQDRDSTDFGALIEVWTWRYLGKGMCRDVRGTFLFYIDGPILIAHLF